MARKTIILASAAWAMAVCAHAQNLPAPTTPLGGTEQIACIQSGAYAACNPSNIASYTASTLPASGYLAYATPKQFGMTVAGPNTNLEVQTMLQSGKAIFMDGLYPIPGGVSVSGCPSITGRDSATTGFMITGTAGGIAISCPATTNHLNGAHMVMSHFGVFTNTVETTGTGALSITASGITPATVAIPTLDMLDVHIGGDVVTTHYFTTLLSVYNMQSYNIGGYFGVGHSGGSLSDTTNGLLISNVSGAPAMVGNIYNSSVYAVSNGYKVLSTTGSSDIEGLSFTNDLAVTVNYGLIADATNTPNSPGLIIYGMQTNAATAAVKITDWGQVWIGPGEYYSNTLASDGIDLIGGNTYNLNPGIVLNVAVGTPSGKGISIAGAGHGSIVGGTIQDYGTALNLDGSSTYWSVGPLDLVSDVAGISNSGANNTIAQPLVTVQGQPALSYNTALNGSLGVFAGNSMASTNGALGFFCNGAAVTPASLASGYYACGNFSNGNAEVNEWNLSNSGDGFEWRQKTGTSTSVSLAKLHYSNSLGALAVTGSVTAPFLRQTVTTVGGLSTIDPSPQAGDLATVSDAVSCTANATPSGSGAVTCGLMYSGAAWKAVVTH